MGFLERFQFNESHRRELHTTLDRLEEKTRVSDFILQLEESISFANSAAFDEKKLNVYRKKQIRNVHKLVLKLKKTIQDSDKKVQSILRGYTSAGFDLNRLEYATAHADNIFPNRPGKPPKYSLRLLIPIVTEKYERTFSQFPGISKDGAFAQCIYICASAMGYSDVSDEAIYDLLRELIPEGRTLKGGLGSK